MSGRRVIVTREDPGALADLLIARGAEMLHVPTVVTDDPPDGGAALRRELAALGEGDWLVVTSPEGARRVASVAGTPGLHLAAVGAATARVLEEVGGRAVDVVPATQRASALAEALLAALGADATEGPPSRRPRVLVAQADRAGAELADTVRAAGLDVVTVVAYRTLLVAPDRPNRDQRSETVGSDDTADDMPGDIPGDTPGDMADDIAGADAILFASGSAVRGWLAGVGLPLPPIVIAIGPSTAAVAGELGVPVSAVAADHSLEGLVTELEATLASSGGPEPDRR